MTSVFALPALAVPDQTAPATAAAACAFLAAEEGSL
jgi:hypothetical protein